MNKFTLIRKVALETSQTKEQTEKMINAITKIIKASVRKGDNVMIRDFGTFTKYKRKARIGHNPTTGKNLKLSAAWKPKFRASKEFKDLVK